RPTGPARQPSQPSPFADMDQPLTLLVSVRELNGSPLESSATVHLSNQLGNQNLTRPTQEASTASFPNVRGGDYEIEVEASGYKPAHERATVNGMSTCTVFIYMTPEGAATNAPADPRPVISPKLQKEMDRGFEALRVKKYEEARRHFLAAQKMAPANPEIEYVLGMIDFLQKSLDAAKGHFGKALQLDPKHEPTLVSLGQLQIETNEFQESAANLENAVLNNVKNSKAHLLLAISYFNLNRFPKA